MGLLVLPLLWRAIDADPAVRDLSRARRDPSWPQATISEARVTVMRADRGSRCSLRPATAGVMAEMQTIGGKQMWIVSLIWVVIAASCCSAAGDITSIA